MNWDYTEKLISASKDKDVFYHYENKTRGVSIGDFTPPPPTAR